MENTTKILASRNSGRLIKTAGIVLASLGLLFASGCAGRDDAHIIDVKEATDSAMSCQMIEFERAELSNKAARLMAEHKEKSGRNAAVFVGGLFLWPIWFAADLSDDEKLEAQAMQDRDAHLKRLAITKGCTTQPVQQAPQQQQKPSVIICAEGHSCASN